MGLQFTVEHVRQKFRRGLTHEKRPSAKNGQRPEPSYATDAGEYSLIQRSSCARSVVNITGLIGKKPTRQAGKESIYRAVCIVLFRRANRLKVL